MYWLGAALLPIIALAYLTGPGMSFGQALVLTGISFVGVYLLVLTHEFGHVFAGRRNGIQTPLVTLSPLGGLAHMAAAAPGPRAEAVVALAGPATHVGWAAILWPLTALLGFEAEFPWGFEVSWAVESLWDANLGLFLFNLLPFFPMDMGRTLRAFLAARMHPNRATLIACRIGIAGAAGLVVWGIVTTGLAGGILLAIGISNWLACTQEMRAARFHTSPYDAGDRLSGWQSDPEAWNRGAASVAEPRPGFLARWRARRRARATEARLREETALAAEVDRILAKVSEVGLPGLTDRERDTLDRASKARRGR
jgi:Zn-dependent protease